MRVNATLDDQVSGTRGYIAPELLAASGAMHACAASDTYAAGVTMAEVVCGAVWQPAPTGSTMADADDGDQRQVYDALDRIEAVEPAIAAVLRLSIAEAPHERPSVDQLATALDGAFAEEDASRALAGVTLA